MPSHDRPSHMTVTTSRSHDWPATGHDWPATGHARRAAELHYNAAKQRHTCTGTVTRAPVQSHAHLRLQDTTTSPTSSPPSVPNAPPTHSITLHGSLPQAGRVTSPMHAWAPAPHHMYAAHMRGASQEWRGSEAPLHMHGARSVNCNVHMHEGGKPLLVSVVESCRRPAAAPTAAGNDRHRHVIVAAHSSKQPGVHSPLEPIKSTCGAGTPSLYATGAPHPPSH